MNPSQQSDIVINSFLETQFLFYLLPCYYGVVALVYRYLVVVQSQPSYYVKHIPGQYFFKYCQSEQERSRNSQTLSYRVLTASYIIKSKLSLFNSYLYLSMVVLTFICTPAMFYSAKHRLHSFLYIFGGLAWYLSAVVLRRQQQRNMPQSIWIHRLFWILAGTFSVYKMFQDYFLPLNLILNICLIISNLILAIYGIYRAEDTDTLLMVTTEEIPSFVKGFFQAIELNERVRYWLGIEDQLNQNLAEDSAATRPEIDNQDLIAIGHVLKRSAQSIKTEINLLNQLPRRNVFVDKKVRYTREGDKSRSCYFILTQVGNSRFEILRTLEEFQELYAGLGQIFTALNFPKHILPRPVGLLGGEVQGNISQKLQSWFQQVLKTPIFITLQLLVFLNVDQQKAAPFIAYFQNSYPTFCSRHYLLVRHNKKQQQPSKTPRQTQFSVYYDRQIKMVEPSDHERILKLIDYQIQFRVSVQSVVGEERSMKIGFNCFIDKKKRLYWDIKKTAVGVGILNQRIQEQCNCSVPIYYILLGSLQTRNRSKINANCKQYLENILNQKKYFCTSLFTFVKLDIIKQEVFTTDGAPLAFQAVVNSGERFSTLVEDYEERGGVVQVVKVERSKRNSGRERCGVRFRRKGLYFNRSSEELEELRGQLMGIYRGVSFIPELKFKNQSKDQVKGMVQNFLLKIENLPKIQIIDEYHTFYGGILRNSSVGSK